MILQSFDPSHAVIQQAAAHDHHAFVEKELAARQAFGFPPFGRLIRVLIQSAEQNLLASYGERLRAAWIERLPADATVYPLVACGIARKKGQHCWQFLVRTAHPVASGPLLAEIDGELTLPRKIRRLVDVDPLTTFF